MAKLNHVFGNYFSLTIPLIKRTRTVVDGTETDTDTDYTPSPSESVNVRLLRHKGRAFSYIPTVDGSHVTIEDEGLLPPGTYDVEVTISGGEHPMRFCDEDTIEIHHITEDAGIVPGETLTATTYTLQGAVFFGMGGSGSDGITPHIDPNTGNWFLGDVDTGVHAQGPQGESGSDGAQGEDGITPHIDPNTGNWSIGDTDTGVHAQGPQGESGSDGAQGEDGITPHIDPNTGNWFIGDTDTGVSAQGPQGESGSDGAQGEDGVTPHIDETTGNWFIGNTDTGVSAQGPQGERGESDKLQIVTPNSLTFTASVGKHYKITDSGTINITLPAVNSSYDEGLLIDFTASADDCLNLSSSDTILKMDGYEIKAGDICEVNCLNTGGIWKVTVVKFETA